MHRRWYSTGQTNSILDNRTKFKTPVASEILKNPTLIPSSAPSSSTERPVRRIAVLGATGSIGLATIEVIEHLRQTDSAVEWHLHAASGHRRIDLLRQIEGRFQDSPQIVVSDPVARDRLTQPERTRFTIGPESLVRVATDPAVDTVVAAVVGSAGLESTLAAAQAGKRIALANKEALVVAGPLIQAAAELSGAELLPIDFGSGWHLSPGGSGSPKIDFDRQRRAISHLDHGPNAGSDAGPGQESSDMGYGRKNHDRFGHDDE
jgi:1-deoxy-D-xylulose 5-phosphate reductoisomerase